MKLISQLLKKKSQSRNIPNTSKGMLETLTKSPELQTVAVADRGIQAKLPAYTRHPKHRSRKTVQLSLDEGSVNSR